MMYIAGAYEKYFKLVTLFFTRTQKKKQTARQLTTFKQCKAVFIVLILKI